MSTTKDNLVTLLITWLEICRYRMNGAFQRFLFQVVALKGLLARQSMEAIKDRLLEAKDMTADSFSDKDQVDMGKCGSYKIVRAREQLEAMRSLAERQDDPTWRADGDSSQSSTVESTFDSLVEQMLPHIKGSVALEDCSYYFCMVEKGAYLPVLHTDTDWNMFPDHDGFQLWYLLDNQDEQNRGNMFMGKTNELSPQDPPVHFEIDRRDGSYVKLGADPTCYPELGRWSAKEAKEKKLIEYEYLDMKPGDCMIMSKHCLHMSDPRLHMAKLPLSRKAFVLRVIVRPSGQNWIRFNPNHPYVKLRITPMHVSMKGRALTDGESEGKGDWRLNVSRIEMHDTKSECDGHFL